MTNEATKEEPGTLTVCLEEWPSAGEDVALGIELIEHRCRTGDTVADEDPRSVRVPMGRGLGHLQMWDKWLDEMKRQLLVANE